MQVLENAWVMTGLWLCWDWPTAADVLLCRCCKSWALVQPRLRPPDHRPGEQVLLQCLCGLSRLQCLHETSLQLWLSPYLNWCGPYRGSAGVCTIVAAAAACLVPAFGGKMGCLQHTHVLTIRPDSDILV